MPRNFTQLYAHCIWATWDRLPLITPDLKKIVYAGIIRQCEQLNCKVLAIGGIADHIHLLVNFPPTLSLSKLIGEVKGSSSHLITHEIKPNEFFKWQGGYGVFTVSQEDLETIAHYIKNQEIHHLQKQLIPDFEIDEITNN